MTSASSYEHRFYREGISAPHLASFTVMVQETDLLILADMPLADRAQQAVINYRYQLEEYIRHHPTFLHALSPLPTDPHAPPIVRDMLQASLRAGVGPMAAVAGAMAARVGEDLLNLSRQVIIENGGDIYLKVSHDLRIGIYAGTSPLSNRLALLIPAGDTPLGICTSSGTVGPSLSFGSADAVTIISPSAPLADAAATAVGNTVRSGDDIEPALQRAREIEGVTGALIIAGDRFGAWGKIEIVSP